VWTGQWNVEWSLEWRERVISILRATAGYGLHVTDRQSLGALPGDLQDRARQVPLSTEQAIGNADVVIGVHSRSESPYVVPTVVFDAIAAGAAVLSPHDDGMVGLFRDLMPLCGRLAKKSDIANIVNDPARRHDAVRHCREIVAYNHTYAHRVATIASGVGYHLVPDGAS
jgi:hypothetical protein